MIYYLAHPWIFNPDESFANAVRWTRTLRKRGLTVFSPILHTHPYWKRLSNGDIGDYQYLKHEKWLEWDLALLDGLAKGDGQKPFTDGECFNGHHYLKEEFPLDLVCQFRESQWGSPCRGTIEPINHPEICDSGVTVLLDRAAYKYDEITRIYQEYINSNKKGKWRRSGELWNWNDYWHSDGCRQEYEFAKAHHIRVLDLSAFMERHEEVEVK